MKKILFYVFILIVVLTVSGCGTTPSSSSRNPIITIVNNTGYDCLFLYVSPVTDEDWGDDVLGYDFLLNGDSYRVRLTQPLSIVDSYDIMLVDVDDDTYTKWGVKLSNGSNIVFTQRDIDQ